MGKGRDRPNLVKFLFFVHHEVDAPTMHST